jgi:hypothetical protein
MMINGQEFVAVESTSFSIEYWYDRKEKLWVVDVFDQVDRLMVSHNCPDRAWLESVLSAAKKEFKTDNVKKV